MAQPRSKQGSAHGAVKKRSAAKDGGALLGKVLPRSKKAWLVTIGGLAFVSLPIVILPQVLPKPAPKAKELPTAEQALAALDREAFTEAVQIADQLTEEVELANDEQGVPAFVRGAVAAHQAEMLWGKDQKNYYVLAAKHLQQAKELGFPDGRQEDGLAMLGKSLYESEQFVAARPVLEEAIDAGANKPTQLHAMLMNVFLHGAERDLKKALVHNEAYLADAKLPGAERQAGLLLRSEIQLNLEDLPGCRETVEQITAKGATGISAAVIRGQLLMHEAADLKSSITDENREERTAAANQKYQDAIAVFRQTQTRSAQAADASRRGHYLIGLCYFEMNETKAAIEQWSRTAKMHMERAEGVAANMQMAELLRQAGRDDEALEAYRNASTYAGDSQSYSNTWIPLADYRARLTNAFQQYLQADNYQRALQITEVMASLMPEENTVTLAAQTRESWARSILAKAEGRSPVEARALEREARMQLRLAGKIYAKLAELRFDTRDFTEAVWKSGQTYFEGHDYRDAIKTFETYLRFELRKRRPRVLVSLAESQLSLGQTEPALAVLHECIEFYPTDSASYQARLLASRAYIEMDDVKQAETLLHENLDGSALAPASREWRDSLFALGRLLHASGQQEEAVRRLEEAVARYPDAPQALESRYLIAESYRQAAATPRGKLAADTLETSRIAHAKQMQELLTQALAYYERVEQILSRRQQKSELTTLEQSILRNCYFARGAALFDLGRYEDAIQAYSTATNRYQYAPESLEAFVQIATCYRRMNKSEKARGTLEQAKVVLSRIRPDANFRDSTNYSAQEWAKMLDWLETL